jgi:hypothetical protein
MPFDPNKLQVGDCAPTRFPPTSLMLQPAASPLSRQPSASPGSHLPQFSPTLGTGSWLYHPPLDFASHFTFSRDSLAQNCVSHIRCLAWEERVDWPEAPTSKPAPLPSIRRPRVTDTDAASSEQQRPRRSQRAQLPSALAEDFLVYGTHRRMRKGEVELEK